MALSILPELHDRLQTNLIASTKTAAGQITTSKRRVVLSPLISNAVSAVTGLLEIGLSPEFCLEHLEDHLQVIVRKSRLLVSELTTYAAASKGKTRSKLVVAQAIGVEVSDMPLLLAIGQSQSVNLYELMSQMTSTTEPGL